MSDAYENIRYEVEAGIATLTVNRPEALNALSTDVLREMASALHAFEGDDAARVLILTGAGDKAFIAGADIKAMSVMEPEEAAAFAELGHGVANALANSKKTTIAAVNGYALGGGTEISLACDLIFASERARFGQPEVKLGVIPGFGGTQRLARAVGPHLAKFLILTGETIKPEEARAMGLVARVYPADALLDEVRKVALTIVEKCGPIAVQTSKQVIDVGLDMTLADGLAYEARRFADMFETDEQREGMAAFIEKRAPKFR